MISLILPIFNMQDYIAECLESVINQTYKDIEIICVNDFSMDNSMTIVKDYAAKDSRIKIINNERNRGLGGARNVGIDAARGEYVIFVDTDDKMMPDMVEKLYENIRTTQADMTFCDMMLLNADNSLTPYKPFHDVSLSNTDMFFPQENFEPFTNMWPSAWNKIYKTAIIRDNNLRYHENILYEDHTFYYEYLLKCQKVSYLAEPLYLYRHQRAGSIMKEISPRIFEIFTILNCIEDIFQKNLDKNLVCRVMPKIALRLLWERTISFHHLKKTKNVRCFISESKKYLKKYRFKDIIKYKDPFIENTMFLRLKKRKLFSKKKEEFYIKYRILGVKFRRKNKKAILSYIRSSGRV